MLKIELNGLELTVYTGVDLALIDFPNKERYFREIGQGLFISTHLTNDMMLKALGYRTGSYDWALPQDWARLNAVPRQDPEGNIYYANPSAVWCYQKDKGCDPIFGSPVWLADVVRDFSREIIKAVKEHVEWAHLAEEMKAFGEKDEEVDDCPIPF